MDPMAIATGAAAAAQSVGSIAGSLLGYRAQEETNQANWNIAHYQNLWNAQMYEKQKADALAQWNRENEYNSPEATMKRMVKAGINPRAQSLGNFANAGSINQPSMPAAAQYDYKSPLAAFQNISSVMSDMLGVAQQLANVEKTKADTGQQNSRTFLNGVLARLYGDRNTSEYEKHQIWRYLNGYQSLGDGAYQFIGNSDAFGSALSKYADDAKYVKSKYEYQDALARAMKENVILGIDANGSWENTLMKLFIRQGARAMNLTK